MEDYQGTEKEDFELGRGDNGTQGTAVQNTACTTFSHFQIAEEKNSVGKKEDSTQLRSEFEYFGTAKHRTTYVHRVPFFEDNIYEYLLQYNRFIQCTP